MEEHHLENISGSDAKRIIELVDQKDIEIEDILFLLKEFIEKRKGVKTMAEFKTREQKVQEFIEKNPNVSYREAVLRSGVTTREDYLAPDEAVRIAGLLDGGISAANLTKDLSVFSEATQKKLNEAYRILTDAKKELELIAEKPLEK